MAVKITVLLWLMIALVLNDCGQNEGIQDAPLLPEQPGASEICVRGQLASEDAQCPAFRSNKGEIYSLVGDIAGVNVGDPICICGSPTQSSSCPQAQTLAINYLDIDCP